MKKKVVKLIYKLIMVACVVIALCITEPARKIEQFWFFTVQTNLFVAIIQTLLIISLIFKMCGKELNFTKSKLFSKLRLLTSFFITITFVIYCFVLAPCGIIFSNKSFAEMFDFRNILLHIIVPAIAFIDYVLFCPKNTTNYRQIWIFIIYPAIYAFLIYLRVFFGSSAFASGSKYPYFFFDPSTNNLGFKFVAVCLIGIAVIILSLAAIYIFMDKKIDNHKRRKTNVKQSHKHIRHWWRR